MSSQSGIIASQSVIDSFNSFVNSNSRCLILKIEIESILIDKEISGTESFKNDWKLINQALSETEARYLFIRKDFNTIVFISFIPDYAQVRSKMLYASTRANLVRQVGNEELIKEEILINSLDEISYEGYEDFLTTKKMEAPLTESEKSLKKINEVDINSLFYGQTGGSSTVVKKSLVRMDHSTNLNGVLIDDDVVDKIQSLSKNELLSLKINSDESIYYVELYTNIKTSNIISSINKIEGPQFLVYKNQLSKLIFIYTCPSGSKIRERMLYASTKQGFLQKLKSEDVSIVKVVEVGDAIEIELSELEEEGVENVQGESNSNVDDTPLSSVAATQLRFNKPKGPRRR